MRPQNLDAPYPSNVLGVILLVVTSDGRTSVKYFEGLHPRNI